MTTAPYKSVIKLGSSSLSIYASAKEPTSLNASEAEIVLLALDLLERDVLVRLPGKTNVHLPQIRLSCHFPEAASEPKVRAMVEWVSWHGLTAHNFVLTETEPSIIFTLRRLAALYFPPDPTRNYLFINAERPLSSLSQHNLMRLRAIDLECTSS